VRAVLDMRGLIDQCVQCVASSLPRTWDACGNMGSPAILSAERLEYSTSNARQQGLSQADLMTAHAHTQGGGSSMPNQCHDAALPCSTGHTRLIQTQSL
jgi:hypothetical protein